jgi:hypothetical protein
MPVPHLQIYGQRPVLWLFCAGLVCIALLKSVEWTFLHTLSVSFDPWALAALVVAQFLLEPDRRAAWITCAVGISLSFVLFRWQPTLGEFAEPISLGIASFIIQCITMLIWPGRRSRTLLVLAAGSLVIIGQQIAGIGQYFTTIEAMTFDNRAYLVDLSLGFNPVGFVLSTVEAMPGLLNAGVMPLLHLAYATILLMMALIVLLHLRIQSAGWGLALTAFLLAGAAGGTLYHVFPAAGPVYAFAAFPELPLSSALTPAPAILDPHYVRNCMPSLHMTFALLIVINTDDLSRTVRSFTIVFTALTIIATLALGQHYLIDLIVAAPFTCAIQAMARSIVSFKWPSPGFWIGSGCVAGWLFVLVVHVEWFLKVPGFTLIVSALTLIVSVLAYRADARNSLAPKRTVELSANTCAVARQSESTGDPRLPITTDALPS